MSCECLSGLSVPSISPASPSLGPCRVVDASLCKSTSCKNQNIDFLFSVCVAALGYLSDSDKTDLACTIWVEDKREHSCFDEALIHCQSLYLKWGNASLSVKSTGRRILIAYEDGWAIEKFSKNVQLQYLWRTQSRQLQVQKPVLDQIAHKDKWDIEQSFLRLLYNW